MDTLEAVVRLAWLVGAAGFVLGLMRMNSPATARNGNLVSAAGMALAIAGTAVLLAVNGTIDLTGWIIILAGIAVGGGLGLYTARTVKMTAMPQLVSLFNAVGGGAAALIAIDDFIRLANVQTFAPGGAISLQIAIPTVLDVVIGSITFTGSIVASGKLQGLIPGKPIQVPGGLVVSVCLEEISVL